MADTPPHPPLPGSTSPSLGSTGSLSSLDDLDITSLPFEGPEKTLEVQFVPKADHPRGLRCLPRSALDQICGRARCTIVSQMSNAYLDAYVLSEVRNELLGTESCEEGTLPLKNTLSLSHLSHVQTSSLAFAQFFFFFFSLPHRRLVPISYRTVLSVCLSVHDHPENLWNHHPSPLCEDPSSFCLRQKLPQWRFAD